MPEKEEEEEEEVEEEEEEEEEEDQEYMHEVLTTTHTHLTTQVRSLPPSPHLVTHSLPPSPHLVTHSLPHFLPHLVTYSLPPSLPPLNLVTHSLTHSLSLSPGESLVNEVVVVHEKEAGQLGRLIAACLVLHVQVEGIQHPHHVVAQSLAPLRLHYDTE